MSRNTGVNFEPLKTWRVDGGVVSDAGEWEGADTVEHFLPPEQTCEII